MSKALQFYVMTELENTSRFCRWHRLVPYKTVPIYINGVKTEHEMAVQYKKKDYIYDVLAFDECICGYGTVLARQPEPSYEQLLEMALTTKHKSERFGSIGIILKKYRKEFIKYISAIDNSIKENVATKDQVKALIEFVLGPLKSMLHYSFDMEDIYILCKQKLRCFY